MSIMTGDTGVEGVELFISDLIHAVLAADTVEVVLWPVKDKIKHIL